MSTNRFDQPIESEYISQYTPIPFEQLYAIGKANNERVDKTYQDLGNQFSKWAEFRSPSAVDTKRWYDLTVGAGQQIVNELASNPDLIKTAEGRSKIQSFINSRPYTELSSLQQSREGMLERQKMNQQLALAGKYNPLWHDVDFTNYDTRQGIFNDLNPLAYKSEVDLVEPYVNNLKSAFIKSDGSYDWSGVSEARTDEQVKANMAAIYNTPEAQMHLRTLVRQGYTPEQAQQLFTDRVYRAGREFAYQNREDNEFAKIAYKYRLEHPGPGVDDAGPFYLTNSIEATGLEKFQNYKNNRLSNTPEYEKLKADLNSSDPIMRSMAQNRMKQLNANTSTKELFRDVLSKYGENKNGKISIDNVNLKYAVNDILNNFSFETKSTEYNDLLQNTIQGITTKEQNTPFGSRKIINGGESLELMSRVVSDIAGFEPVATGRNKISNALKSGKLNNMILMSSNNILSLPTTKNGQPSTNNMQAIKVAISEQDLEDLGITESDLKIAGANPITSNQTVSSTETGTMSGKVKKTNDAGLPLDNIWQKVSNTQTKTVRGGQKYWMLDLVNSIPSSDDKINAEYLNQQALKLNITNQARTGLYPKVQNEAFGF